MLIVTKYDASGNDFIIFHDNQRRDRSELVLLSGIDIEVWGLMARVFSTSSRYDLRGSSPQVMGVKLNVWELAQRSSLLG